MTHQADIIGPQAVPGRQVCHAAGDLALYLLGGFQAMAGGRRVSDSAWRLRKARLLIQFLALARNHTLHREQVMDLFWPDLPPEAAAGNLYQVIHAARRALGGAGREARSPIQFRQQVIRLLPAGRLWIDVEAFESAAAAARRSSTPAAYEAALRLYGGELLPENPYDDRIHGRREALHRLCLSLLLDRARAHETERNWPLALDAYRQAAEFEPAGETAHLGWLRALVHLGRQEEARRKYELWTCHLREELGTEPSLEARRAYARLCRQGTVGRSPGPGDAPATPHRHNLPAPLTSLVGRRQETVQVRHQLAQHRLVTLTGEGGCGKTRLALAAASDMLNEFPDGVWFIDLAPLNNPVLAAPRLAAVLGIAEDGRLSPTDRLTGALAARSTLLVMDNCEHLAEACGRLAVTLLPRCPGLRILVTSRHALGVDGEVILRTPTLPVPDPGDHTHPDRMARYEAVQLFVERARLVVPGFQLDQRSAEAVARICARLEGLPLAIELAAARLAALSPRQLAQRLDQTLNVLTATGLADTARHRTLRGSLDWSYGLLSPEDRLTLSRLSVFRGGWTLEAAAAVAGSEGSAAEIPATLERLVRRSLVQVDRHALDPRFRMLETIREYAGERLDPGAAAAARDRHAAYFHQLAVEAAPRLRGPGQLDVVAMLEREQDNLRAALDRLVHCRRGNRALQLTLSLQRFWEIQGSRREARAWLERILALPGLPVRPALAAMGHFWIGRMAYLQGDHGAARRRFAHCLRMARRRGDAGAQAHALVQVAHMALRQGEYAAARRRYLHCAAIWRRLGQSWYLGVALTGLGHVEVCQGKGTAAAPHLREALEIYTALGDGAERARCLLLLGQAAMARNNLTMARRWLEAGLQHWRAAGHKSGTARGSAALARVACAEGRFQEARRLWSEALNLFREMGQSWGVAQCLEGFALLAAGCSRAEGALRLAAWAGALRKREGIPLEPVNQAWLAEGLAAAEGSLTDDQRHAARLAGLAMTLDEAVALAVS